MKIIKSKIYKQKIIDDYTNGKSMEEIGQSINLCPVQIGKVLKQNNIHIKTNKDYRKYTLNINFFEKIDSHEKAAIFGFICADGYNHQKMGRIRIGINKKDIDYLYKINKFIQPNRYNAIKFTYSTGFNKQNKNNLDTAYTVIYCKKMSDDLAKLGCEQAKSLTLEFPKIDNEFLPSFLVGYFDGDGSVSFSHVKKHKKRIYYVGICASHIFAKECSRIVQDTINVRLGITNRGKFSYLYASSNGKVEQFLDWIYSKSPVKLDRKYKIYLEMKEYFKNYK